MTAQPIPPTPPGREADEVDSLHPAQRFLLRLWEEHHSLVVVGLLALLAAAVLVNWAGRGRSEARHRAAERLDTAAGIYQQIILTDVEETDRAEELLTRATELCDEIRLEYPQLEAARLALHIRGGCLYERAYHHMGTEAGNERATDLLDRAIADFTAFRDEAINDQERAQALIALANCYENRAFLTADDAMMRSAIAELAEAADLGAGSHLEAQALVDQARCLESFGRFDEARLIYERITQMRPALEASLGTGPLSLSRSGGYREYAAERIERLASGIDAPRGS